MKYYIFNVGGFFENYYNELKDDFDFDVIESGAKIKLYYITINSLSELLLLKEKLEAPIIINEKYDFYKKEYEEKNDIKYTIEVYDEYRE